MTANLLKPIIYGIAAVFYLAVLILCFASPATVKKINTGVHKVMLVLSEIALALMIVIVFITVVLRYCFNTGIGWAEEVPRLLVNFFAFCACAIGVRDHLHISVNIFYNLFAKDGIVYGMQCETHHFHLGFDMIKEKMMINGHQEIVNNQPFLHVGRCIHVDIIKQFLNDNKIKYYVGNSNDNVRVVND